MSNNDAQSGDAFSAAEIDDALGDEGEHHTNDEGYVVPQCPDSHTPYIGRSFSCIEEATNFYFEYARICGFSARHGTAHSHKDGTIITKRFLCHREGFTNNAKAVDTMDLGKRDSRNRKVTRTGCKAKCCIKFRDGGMYYVYDFEKSHNHPLATESGRQFLKNSRCLTFTQQNLMLDCGRLGMGATKTHRFMAEMAGGYENVGATLSDFKNFKRDLKMFIGGCDAQMVVEQFEKRKASCPGYSFEYFADENDTLTRVFWADPISKRDSLLFADVISFDATYSTNKYKMVFIPFTGVDNHRKSITLAAGLLAQEDADSYIWLLQCFRKFLDHDPIMFVTDQDLAMKKAIAIVFPSVQHRYCMWHISEKMKAKVGVALCSGTDFIKCINRVIWGEYFNPEDFENDWKQVISDFNLDDHEWLSDIYNIRDHWIPVYFRNVRMGLLTRTTSRSESENSFFSKFLHSNMTLVEFILAFDSAMVAQRHPRVKLDHESRTTSMPLKTPLEIEIDALETYTHTIFAEVQSEILASGYMCAVDDIGRNSEDVLYNIKDKDGFKSNFEVTFNKASCTGKCNCMKFETTGIICRHLLLVLSYNEVNKLPKQYVLPRWHKYANVVEAATDFGNKIESCAALACEAWFEFRSLVDLASNNKGTLAGVVEKIKTMKSELLAKDNTCGVGTKSDFFKSVTGMEQPTAVKLKSPNISKNKGRCKRIKSSREIGIIQSKRTKRLCSICGKKEYHDARNCPNKMDDDANTNHIDGDTVE